jgi:hypothetical protein
MSHPRRSQEDTDEALARHITYVHRMNKHPELDFEPFSPEFMRSSILMTLMTLLTLLRTTLDTSFIHRSLSSQRLCVTRPPMRALHSRGTDGAHRRVSSHMPSTLVLRPPVSLPPPPLLLSQPHQHHYHFFNHTTITSILTTQTIRRVAPGARCRQPSDLRHGALAAGRSPP